MAVTTVDYDAPSGLSRYSNSDSNATKSGVKASSGTIHAIIIDNTANAAASSAASQGITAIAPTSYCSSPDTGTIDGPNRL